MAFGVHVVVLAHVQLGPCTVLALENQHDQYTHMGSRSNIPTVEQIKYTHNPGPTCLLHPYDDPFFALQWGKCADGVLMT